MATIELSDDELKALKDMLNLGQALISSVSAPQVAGWAARIGEVAPSLEAASSSRMVQSFARAGDDMADLIDLVMTYHRSGAVKKTFDFITFVSVIGDALSTPTVAHLAETANQFLIDGHQLVSGLQAVGGVHGLVNAAHEASAQAEEDHNTIGVAGLLGALKEPEVQRAIKVIPHFLRIMGRRP